MSVSTISSSTLKQWLDNQEVELIDVREDIEFHSSHIAGALHVPLSKINSEHLPQNDKKKVIYCLRGARGQKACEKLASQSPDSTFYNLEGGIEAWKVAAQEVVTGSTQIMPLDRQVQITIGLAVLGSVIASQMVHINWIWLAGFFGAGLLFAGLSGTCGLARLLAMMPWNKISV
jgi:rhodanese-related sulfurtransferase